MKRDTGNLSARQQLALLVIAAEATIEGAAEKIGVTRKTIYEWFNQKWIAEQTGTSIAMIQEHYGKYIRDDGDALLRAYVEESKSTGLEEKTGTFSETFSNELFNYPTSLASPTGFEPVLPA